MTTPFERTNALIAAYNDAADRDISSVDAIGILQSLVKFVRNLNLKDGEITFEKELRLRALNAIKARIEKDGSKMNPETLVHTAKGIASIAKSATDVVVAAEKALQPLVTLATALPQGDEAQDKVRKEAFNKVCNALEECGESHDHHARDAAHHRTTRFFAERLTENPDEILFVHRMSGAMVEAVFTDNGDGRVPEKLVETDHLCAQALAGVDPKTVSPEMSRAVMKTVKQMLGFTRLHVTTEGTILSVLVKSAQAMRDDAPHAKTRALAQHALNTALTNPTLAQFIQQDVWHTEVIHPLVDDAAEHPSRAELRARTGRVKALKAYADTRGELTERERADLVKLEGALDWTLLQDSRGIVEVDDKNNAANTGHRHLFVREMATVIATSRAIRRELDKANGPA